MKRLISFLFCLFLFNSSTVFANNMLAKTHALTSNMLLVNWSWLRSILSSLNNSGGFLANLVLYILIPLALAYVIIYLPALLFGKLRFFNNFFYVIIAFPVAFIVAINIAMDLCGNAAFHNNLGEPWIFICMLVLSWLAVWGVWKQRCPKCRSMSFHLADEYSETQTWQEKDVLYQNGNKIAESEPRKRSKTTRHNLRECNECGRQWWVSF